MTRKVYSALVGLWRTYRLQGIQHGLKPGLEYKENLCLHNRAYF